MTKNDILNDPCAPFWAKDIIRMSERIDIVDYINGLEVLLKEARERAESISVSAGWGK